MSNWDKAEQLYDDKFCRMWEYQLAGSDLSFRHIHMNNFQIQFCRDQYSLPFTRDYFLAEEARLKGYEAKSKNYKAVQ